MPIPAVLNVGFYNYVVSEKVVAIMDSDSAPMKRIVQEKRKFGHVIDATQGRRTKCIIFTTGPEIILSAVSQETLAKRLSSGELIADEE